MSYYTVTERSENGDEVTPWRVIFRTIEEAVVSVEEDHEQQWGEAEMGGDAPRLNMVATPDVVHFMVEDAEIEWSTWIVTKVELS